jgi:hypothetical protein
LKKTNKKRKKPMKNENKKVYFAPEMSVVEFTRESHLLQGSCIDTGNCDTGMLNETVYGHDKA